MKQPAPFLSTVPPAPPRSIICGYFTNKAPGEVFLKRGLPEWFFILTLRGKAWLRDGAQQIVLEPGDLIAYRPDTPQNYGHARSPAWKMAWTQVFPRAEWLDWLTWPEPVPGLLRLRFAPELLATVAGEFEKMFSLQEDRSRRYRLESVMNQMERFLLVCSESSPTARSSKSGDSRLMPAVQRLTREYQTTPKLADLARTCGMSRSVFARLFAECTGETPMAFLEHQRISRALYLLHETELSVSEIAEDVGFVSPFYFTRRFKKSIGKSPRDYRAAVLRQKEEA